jgi:hypothetical protein
VTLVVNGLGSGISKLLISLIDYDELFESKDLLETSVEAWLECEGIVGISTIPWGANKSSVLTLPFSEAAIEN